jgi:hypothetical protein
MGCQFTPVARKNSLTVGTFNTLFAKNDTNPSETFQSGDAFEANRHQRGSRRQAEAVENLADCLGLR